jgi:predicted metal-binding protein
MSILYTLIQILAFVSCGTPERRYIHTHEETELKSVAKVINKSNSAMRKKVSAGSL